MYFTWLRSRLATITVIAVFALSTAFIGLAIDSPALARGGGGGFGGGGGMRGGGGDFGGGGGFSRSGGFDNSSMSRSNLDDSHSFSDNSYDGDRTGGWGTGPGDNNVNVNRNYNVNGGGWGYGWGGAAVTGAAVGAAVAGSTVDNTCDNPVYYGATLVCE